MYTRIESGNNYALPAVRAINKVLYIAQVFIVMRLGEGDSGLLVDCVYLSQCTHIGSRAQV